MAVVRNILVVNDLEGVGDFYTLTCVGGVVSNGLAETTKFVGVLKNPDLFVICMVGKLAIFEGLASGCIKDR